MYEVKLTSTAHFMLKNMHPEVKKEIKFILKRLYENPYLGKELRNELVDFRSLKMKRYRILYKIDISKKFVIVYAIGHRRDIYEIASKILSESNN